MSDSDSILLATRNPAKQEKLRWLLDDLGYALTTPADYPPLVEPEEAGDTHRQVAARKARFWAAHVGGLAIASDGGVCIPSLGDRWNSLFTRRAAGETVDDRNRADHLLGLMQGRKGNDRDIVWVEGLALARSGELVASWEVEGALGRLVERYEPRDLVGGFWMPGMIYVPRYGKVLARLTEDERAEADLCWNELRRRVRAYLEAASRQ